MTSYSIIRYVLNEEKSNLANEPIYDSEYIFVDEINDEVIDSPRYGKIPLESIVVYKGIDKWERVWDSK